MRGVVARGVLIAFALSVSSCLSPTEIIVELSTNVMCRVVAANGVAIAIGPKGDDNSPITTVTSMCSSDRGIGSLVVTPSTSTDDEVGIRVMLGVDASADSCTGPSFDGCIVARRSLRYDPHTPLTLPIALDQSCIGVPCTPDSTCLGGTCVDASVDPCTGPCLTDAPIVIPPGTACGTIAAVQAVPGTTVQHVMQVGGSQSQTITETAGNLLVAIVYSGQGVGSTTASTAPNMTFTVTDSLGNTFYAGPLVENGLRHESALQIFFAPQIKGGTNIVTASTNAPPALAGSLQTGLLLQEYSGIAATDVVDVSSAQVATTPTLGVSPGPMTTLTGCDLVVGAFTDGFVPQQNITTGAGWGYRSTDVWCPAGAVDNMPAGTLQGTSVDALMSLVLAPDDGWAAVQTAFRAAGSPPLPHPSNIAVTTAPQTVSATTCSTVVTVEAQLQSNPWPSSTGISMNLSGGGLSFFADSQCDYPITTLYLGAGVTSQSFYFTAASSGTQTITVSPNGLGPVTQSETIL